MLSAQSQADKEAYTEPYSQIRLKEKYEISQTTMESHSYLPLSQIFSYTSSSQKKYFSIGVITMRQLPRKSSLNHSYLLLKISPMGPLFSNDLFIFIYGEAYQTYWRQLMEGTVILIQDWKIVSDLCKRGFQTERNEGKAISVEKKDQLSNLGYCVDYGKCQALKLQTAEACKNAIDVRHGPFCQYHVSKRLQKVRQNRPTMVSFISTSTNNGNKNSNQNKNTGTKFQTRIGTLTTEDKPITKDAFLKLQNKRDEKLIHQYSLGNRYHQKLKEEGEKKNPSPLKENSTKLTQHPILDKNEFKKIFQKDEEAMIELYSSESECDDLIVQKKKIKTK